MTKNNFLSKKPKFLSLFFKKFFRLIKRFIFSYFVVFCLFLLDIVKKCLFLLLFLRFLMHIYERIEFYSSVYTPITLVIMCNMHTQLVPHTHTHSFLIITILFYKKCVLLYKRSKISRKGLIFNDNFFLIKYILHTLNLCIRYLKRLIRVCLTLTCFCF